MTPAQLKSSILQLAIQGKLVPQIPAEGTGEELYQQIQKEKQALIKSGKIKKEKPLPPIAEDEIPFEIPEGWRWCRLGEICKSITDGDHQPPPQTSEGIPFLVISNVSNGQLDFTNTRFVSKEYFNSLSNDRIAESGDILFTVTGSYGIPIVVNTNRIFCFQRHISLLKIIGNLDYIYITLLSPIIKEQCDKQATGTAQKTVGLTALRNMIIPLPPLAEQKRIVAKIEELMPLIDRYDKAWTQLEAIQKKFPGDLKKSILQQAIQGKLVPQIPAEGTGEGLYQQIQKEKQALIKSGKIKKEKPLPPIADDEIPFEIPEEWQWCRLRNIVYNRGQETPSVIFSYIDIGSIDNLHQCLNNDETIIEPDKAPSRARKIVAEGDILYSTVRPYLHNMCIINKPFSFKPIASTGFAVMTCYNGVYNKFLFYCLLSPFFDSYANDNENSKGVAYPAINDDRLYRALIPLPPLAEQRRIVAKIEALMPLCDKLIRN